MEPDLFDDLGAALDRATAEDRRLDLVRALMGELRRVRKELAAVITHRDRWHARALQLEGELVAQRNRWHVTAGHMERLIDALLAKEGE